MTRKVGKVIEILVSYGVQVQHEIIPLHSGDDVLLSKGDIEEWFIWDSEIGGDVIKRLSRAFDIPLIEFYSDTPNPTTH